MLQGVLNQISGIGKIAAVNTYADLASITGAAIGDERLVLTATGVWPVNRKSAGIYYYDGTTWTFKGAAPNDAGIPSGGTAGQALTKIDGTDFNMQWSTVGGGGSSDPLVLANTASPIAAPTTDVKKVYNKSNSEFPSIITIGRDAVGSMLQPALWEAQAQLVTPNGTSYRALGYGGDAILAGTFTQIPDTTLIDDFGYYGRITTNGASNTDVCIRYSNGQFNAYTPTTGSAMSGGIYMTTTIAFAQIGLQRFRFGAMETNLIGDFNLAGSLSLRGFCIENDLSNGQSNFYYQIKNSSGTPTAVDTGMLVSVNKLYRLYAHIVNASRTVFRIDNLTDNTTTGDIVVTNTWDSNVNLRPYPIAFRSIEPVAKSMYWTQTYVALRGQSTL